MDQEEMKTVSGAADYGIIFRRMSETVRMRSERPDDYIGDDGFVHCANCRGRKQRFIDTKSVGLGKIKVWCMCPCLAEEARKEQQAEREAMERAERMERNRQMADSLRRQYMQDDLIQSASFDIFFSDVFTDEYDTPETRRLYKIATRYVEHFDTLLRENKGMIFFGPTGTGKTFTAACIANALLDRGVPVIMTSLAKLTDSIDFNDASKSATAIIERFNKADLLIIDDLGVERSTSFALEKQYEFINGRYASKKPMILTTNLTRNQLLKASNIDMQRVYERIYESSYLVSFDGPSLRKKRAKEMHAYMSMLLEGD